jgi:hypothetical protein
MPGYVAPDEKGKTPKLKLDGQPKAKPGRKPGSTLASTEKKKTLPKKSTDALAKKQTTSDSSKKDKDGCSSSSSQPWSPTSSGGKSNGHPPQLSPHTPTSAHHLSHSHNKTEDSAIYDFQSDDADSQKAFSPVSNGNSVKAVGAGTGLATAGGRSELVQVKKYWTPPANFSDKGVVITDVVTNGIPITFRESRCPDFLTVE